MRRTSYLFWCSSLFFLFFLFLLFLLFFLQPLSYLAVFFLAAVFLVLVLVLGPPSPVLGLGLGLDLVLVRRPSSCIPRRRELTNQCCLRRQSRAGSSRRGWQPCSNSVGSRLSSRPSARRPTARQRVEKRSSSDAETLTIHCLRLRHRLLKRIISLPLLAAPPSKACAFLIAAAAAATDSSGLRAFLQVMHCLSCVSTALLAKALLFACVSTALLAKALPFACVSTAFFSKALPFACVTAAGQVGGEPAERRDGSWKGGKTPPLAVCVPTAFVAKTPLLPCAFHYLRVDKTPPLPCVPTAFVAKTVSFCCASTAFAAR